MVWVSRSGEQTSINAPPRGYVYPRLSPDGSRVAIDVREQGGDIWTWDLRRENLTRVTVDPARDAYPVWTPDGTHILFVSARSGQDNIFRQAADGSGTAERLTDSSESVLPYSISPDGTRLLLRRIGSSSGPDLAILNLSGKPRIDDFQQSAFAETNGDISPDGRWVAYQSDESGQAEVYVRPLNASAAGRWLISSGGGVNPLWARTGKDLFYQNGDVMMAVPVQLGASFSASRPTKLFEAHYSGGLGGRAYDATSDGQRFLMLRGETNQTDGIVMAINWLDEVKRHMAVK
jgi:serine/threonine-protein kinase